MQKVEISKLDIQKAHQECANSATNIKTIHKENAMPYAKAFIIYAAIICLIMCIFPLMINSLINISPIFKNQLILNTICYSALSAITAFCIASLITYYRRHKIVKTVINIFDKNEINNINSNLETIIIPTKLDGIAITSHQIFIFKKQNNKLKFLTIIDRDDPNFNEQKFWQTHTTLTKEYLNGNLSSKENNA